MTDSRYQEVLGSAVAEKVLNMRRVLQHVQDKHLRAKHGITFPQFAVLEGVMHEEGVNLGTLAAALHCTRGNITGIVDRLEHSGYITRQRDRADRRVVKARLTGKGKNIAAIQEELAVYLAGFASVLSPEELATLAMALKRLHAELKRKAG